ncbi:wax ester/triacylglycerol synthase family O-acyltransferase [Micromonospora andamanensis]|uniref:Diacylglycerol O-acyltransferase n=1 Tax=Micromonospora andamanensis TaxID=1287068 RepID=A0ABQ4HZL3_9ACTN|nr:wax ester/triacylglycerol synthase family O-acyltransferase [Micromonospora andamanensis]GIJ11085.1 putative diacyglycerol O-acyltransferase [Micromonospora andamanensis]
MTETGDTTQPTLAMNEKFFLVVDSATVGQHVAMLAVFSPPDGADADFPVRLLERLRKIRTFAAPFNYVLDRPALRKIAPSMSALPDDQIDLDRHLRYHRLPAPGGQRELDDLIAELHSPRLDFGRPLWEYHLIDGLANGRFATYVKFHHAVMDGVGWNQRFTQSVTLEPEDQELRPIWTIGPNAARPAPLAPAPMKDVMAVRKEMKRNAKRAVPEIAAPYLAPKTVLNGRLTRRRRATTVAYPLDRIRGIAKTAGVTVNDVLVSSVAGGLRRYLEERGELPSKSLIASAPYNIRLPGDDATLNAYSTILITMFTDIAHPVERLKAVARSSGFAKRDIRSRTPEVAVMYSPLIGGTWTLNQMTGLAGRTAPPFSTIVSCIPGPDSDLYLGGAHLDAMFPIGPLYHGSGLIVAALTISGTFGIGFHCCPDTVPGIESIARYTAAALDDLESTLAVGAGT